MLGYSDTNQAIRKRVDNEDKLTRCFDGSGQSREMIIINESGLYSLILSSKLPSAKKFKRWVTIIWNYHRPNEREILQFCAETFGINGRFENVSFMVGEKQSTTHCRNERVLFLDEIIDPATEVSTHIRPPPQVSFVVVINF